MKTIRQVIFDRMGRSADLYDVMKQCEHELDVLLPPYVEVAAARPLEGFFRTSVVPPPPPSLPSPEVLGATIRQRIRARREQLRMTQQQMAKETGIKRPNIARLERGRGLPNMSTLLKVAAALDVPLDFFIES